MNIGLISKTALLHQMASKYLYRPLMDLSLDLQLWQIGVIGLVGIVCAVFLRR